ncbi:MAG: hypothetical protein ACRBCT_00120 [Alphaproteobacteria bacterium]
MRSYLGKSGTDKSSELARRKILKNRITPQRALAIIHTYEYLITTKQIHLVSKIIDALSETNTAKIKLPEAVKLILGDRLSKAFEEANSPSAVGTLTQNALTLNEYNQLGITEIKKRIRSDLQIQGTPEHEHFRKSKEVFNGLNEIAPEEMQELRASIDFTLHDTAHARAIMETLGNLGMAQGQSLKPFAAEHLVLMTNADFSSILTPTPL